MITVQTYYLSRLEDLALYTDLLNMKQKQQIKIIDHDRQFSQKDGFVVMVVYDTIDKVKAEAPKTVRAQDVANAFPEVNFELPEQPGMIKPDNNESEPVNESAPTRTVIKLN